MPLDPNAVPGLLRALDSADVYVRSSFAESSGESGDVITLLPCGLAKAHLSGIILRQRWEAEFRSCQVVFLKFESQPEAFQDLTYLTRNDATSKWINHQIPRLGQESYEEFR